MNYRELIILLPCHSLEDFPLHHRGDAAAGLLANWTALWHPALLAAAQSLPGWRRADSPPEDFAERLVVAPAVSLDLLPEDAVRRAEAQGGRLIRGLSDRRAVLEQALAGLDGGDQGVDPDLAADFLALGYAYLQIELLTRQMRYSSNLDEAYFEQQALPAAAAALDGDVPLARQKLGACFDLLAEERDHYYPVESYLADVTLAAPTTLGPALRRELDEAAHANLLISAEVLEQMAERASETWAALRRALEQGRLSLVGGERREAPLPLMSCEALLAHLREGRDAYVRLLGRAPAVYGRRRFGLTPALPQILLKLGYIGALHATLEDGRFPEGGQVKVRWGGCGEAAIDALAKAPRDAAAPETFLSLGNKLGESMDMDHVATVWVAHWPGLASCWRDDVLRVARYGPVLGKLVTLEQYFQETDTPSQLERFKADQYRSPYLRQAVAAGQPDPLSRVARWWRRRALAETVESLACLAVLLGGQPPRDERWTRRVDATLEGPQADDDQLDGWLDEGVRRAAAAVAAALPRGGEPRPGRLLLNPLGCVRRQLIDVEELAAPPEPRPPIYAAAPKARGAQAVVDAPSFGYAWVEGGPGAWRPPRRPPPPMAEGCVLRNEFFEAAVNPQTGALQSVYVHNQRGNRISQQVAFRLPAPGGRRRAPARYTVMAADAVEVTACEPLAGELTSRGRLLESPRGPAVAEFTQRVRATRGSRLLELTIELNPIRQPDPADPWRSYYACRFAWANEAASLFRGLHHARQPAESRRFEAPQYIEIDDVDAKTTILTGGLPYHQRQGRRMLDTLLIVAGERARRFQLAVGFDLRNPLHDALSWLAPACVVPGPAAPPQPASAWLARIDARNVAVTWWAPLWEDGQAAGVRMRLMETRGRATRASLELFREPRSARQVDFCGRALGDCRIEDGRIRLQLASHEWIELEVRW